MPDIDGIPYVEPGDLVSGYPSVSQSLAQEVSDQLASKLDIAGKRIVQIRRSNSGVQQTTTSTSFVNAGIDIPFTPLYADSSLLVIWTVNVFTERDGTGAFSFARLQITDDGNSALDGAEDVRVGLDIGVTGARHGFRGMQTLIGLVPSTGSTSARTYKGRYAALNAGTEVTLNNDVTSGRIYVLEISE